MHIGLNAQLLSFSQNYRNGGVSRYIRYLLKGLAEQTSEYANDNEYTIFVNGPEIIERLPQHPRMTYVSAPWPENKPAARVAWEQFVLPTLVQKRKIDVFHSPVNVLPERLPKQCATVVTLHDLAFLRFPHVLTRFKRLYHQTFTIRSLKRANMLITVSESTKQDVHELVGIARERIQTVYPCIDKKFQTIPTQEALQAFRRQQGLTEGFILYLGTLEPRKNIQTLIEAYAQLRQHTSTREKLVIAGGKGWLYDTIFARVQELRIENEVMFPGFVADTEQALWYHAATAFAFPSLYEGFGIPVAEALACGVPVVTSNISSLPEAGANVALCIDPHNPEALAEALHQAIHDPLLRARTHEMAPVVAEQFSLQHMIEQTQAAYQMAAERHRESRSQHSISVVQ